MKGNFWRGAEIKRTRGKYAHVRRKMQRKKLMKDVKKLKDEEDCRAAASRNSE